MPMNRTDIILKYIVEYFIKHAQPVGSQTLIDEYHLSFSSATIRNEMMELEKRGYLEKTHTSSGRVPSSKGYRYYCEHLRNGKIDQDIKYSLQTVLTQKMQSIEETIKASCEVISHMTNLVSIVIGPDENSERLASLQLVPISETSFTAIFVTDKGYVENKTFIIPQGMKMDDVVKCVSLLNERLIGTPIPELVNKMESLRPILNDYIVSHDVVYQALLETFVRFAGDRLSLYGREELFSHPEFKNDSEKLLKVLTMLNDESIFKEISETENQDNAVNLKIGDVEGNPDVSMVTARFKVGDHSESTIALLGPTRMDYDKAMSALQYLQEELTKYFNGNNQGGNNGGRE